MIQAGFSRERDPISDRDGIWPNELDRAAGGVNLIWGYMWVPDGWTLTAEGAYEFVEPLGSRLSLDRQLNGTGTQGIVNVRRDGNQFAFLSSPAEPLNERGNMPTLHEIPATPDAFDGNFQLVGLNFFRQANYLATVRFDIAPDPNTPDAPFVEQPCFEYGEVVEGYGPDYNNIWDDLGVLEDQLIGALVAAHQIATGCVTAVADFLGSIVDAVRLVDDFLADPEAFLAQIIADIRMAVETAVDDPGEFVTAALRGVLQLDLLEENPALWVGTVGCQIILEVLIGLTGAGAAALAAKITEEVLDFIRTQRRLNGDDNNGDNGDGPNNPCSALRSFSADTEVLLADGTTIAIADVGIGDLVWAHDPQSGEAGARAVTAVWPHDDTLLEFEVGNATVTTTEDHEFWNVSDQAWQETQHIDAGDLLLTADGATVEAGTLL